ncbi:TIGR02808 family protein [Motiliproteus sp. MSK22-1]|nr:TIGR02808 family protein [Motiliproteus sp. MSK22-1]OMH26604.1 TIGR02808 family protein [Motiliproteus sp. MSK22-1]
MSTLEYIIWQILGYSAMPLILLIGFVGVSVFTVWILSLTSDKERS